MTIDFTQIEIAEMPKDYTYQKEDGSWWHFDETWDLNGPYETKEEAGKALEIYLYYLEGIYGEEKSV